MLPQPNVIPQPGHASPLYGREAQARQPHRGLEKLYQEAKQEVASQKQLEAAAIGQRAAALQQPEQPAEQGQKADFVQVGGVARDAVAKIEAPGQARGRAEGAVFEATEVAAEPADGQPQQQRIHHEVAATGRDAKALFGELHPEQTSQEAAHDGFVGGVVEPAAGRVQQ